MLYIEHTRFERMAYVLQTHNQSRTNKHLAAVRDLPSSKCYYERVEVGESVEISAGAIHRRCE